jgi:hypothetical protein
MYALVGALFVAMFVTGTAFGWYVRAGKGRWWG